MTVQARMAKATTKPGMCGTCDGRIEITADDFAEVADLAPDTDAQFDELVRRAHRGAAGKCNGCDVMVVERRYDKQSLNGVIHCKGSDVNGVPTIL